MNNDFQIGRSKVGESFTKNKWFYLAPGDNIFRILPPVHSLATTGQFSKFYAFHSGFPLLRGLLLL